MKFIEQLLTPESLATFTTTMLGVFVGFLLSAWQYNKQKEKADNELELKYTLLIKNEFEHSINAFKYSLKDIDNFLSENKMFDDKGEVIALTSLKEDKPTQEEAKKIFIAISQYLESLVSDRALLSASRAGSTKPVMLDDVIGAYHGYNLAINKVKEYSDNLQRGLRYGPENNIAFYMGILLRLRSYCIELDEIYKKGVESLEELEKELN